MPICKWPLIDFRIQPSDTSNKILRIVCHTVQLKTHHYTCRLFLLNIHTNTFVRYNLIGRKLLRSVYRTILLFRLSQQFSTHSMRNIQVCLSTHNEPLSSYSFAVIIVLLLFSQFSLVRTDLRARICQIWIFDTYYKTHCLFIYIMHFCLCKPSFLFIFK